MKKLIDLALFPFEPATRKLMQGRELNEKQKEKQEKKVKKL